MGKEVRFELNKLIQPNTESSNTQRRVNSQRVDSLIRGGDFETLKKSPISSQSPSCATTCGKTRGEREPSWCDDVKDIVLLERVIPGA